MNESILKSKSYDFALEIVKECKTIISDRKEYILCNQLLRSGTATGALIREAEFARAKADFISKLYIAPKESNETDNRISLLRDSSVMDAQTESHLELANKELLRMLVSSIKTAKQNKP